VDFTKLLACIGFEWDEGNAEKNWEKHQVSRSECEQIFFNQPLVVAADEKHSQAERRYYTMGQTDKGRRLFIIFTLRGDLLRVISARDQSRSERCLYDQEKNPEIP
jgi:uncharacterized DUF497 family protein